MLQHNEKKTVILFVFLILFSYTCGSVSYETRIEMKKIPLVIVIIFWNFFSLTAQNNNYYYYRGEKISIPISYGTSDPGPVPFIQISDIFYVKLKKVSDLNLLQRVANQKNVSIVHQNSFMPLWYKLRINKGVTKSSVQLSNEFYETGYFSEVDPAFKFKFSTNCSNDTDFGKLWGLKNTKVPGIDINICDAWSITKGEGVKVAVVDTGIDKTHHDLNDNIHPLSYDSKQKTNSSIKYRSHATHVAGIIGAEKDNKLQVVGVAPKSKIMDVSNPLSIGPTISEDLADAINWAVKNGADIINNSWGDQGGYYYRNFRSSLLESAIDNALKNGRNGLGTIMVFASGNRFPLRIDYPGNYHDDILVVGAINYRGNRASFYAYGSDLDVVAPGVDIYSTVPHQSVKKYNGTSMAAPHVAGIAALILSINPN